MNPMTPSYPEPSRESVSESITQHMTFTARAVEVPEATVHLMALLTNERPLFDASEASYIFSKMDVYGRGAIGVKQLREGMRKGAVRAFFSGIDSAVARKLLSEDDVEFAAGLRALGRENGDGNISKAEWGAFISDLGASRVTYLLKSGLIMGRCYHAFGSWRDDLKFYVKNQHPIASMFMVPKVNEYKGMDRAQTELLTVLFVLLLSFSTKDTNLTFWIGCFGSVAFAALLFYVNACPCLLTKHRQSTLMAKVVRSLKLSGHRLTNLVVLVALVLCFTGVR